jgi:ketosteroid isomerase-like protein
MLERPFRAPALLAGLMSATIGAAVMGQESVDLPVPLLQMVEAERAFAARARVVGWKNAFLEYLADTAVGFDGTESGPARDQIRRQPDPPKDLQLLWEPRYGDVAASGELGYLTGPVTSINPSRNQGMPRYSNYASVWKRQGDGSFKVVMDVGIPTPDSVPFPPGVTRPPQANRYTGPADAKAQAALREADGTLTERARKDQAEAYRGRLAPGARLHRAGLMPMTTETNILQWLGRQPPYASGETRYAETAGSGDLGYTWGSYSLTPPGSATSENGFYVRVWSRDSGGAWKVALDVLQPQ